jgi:hypothetical protein
LSRKAEKRALATNCNVLESPLGETCSRGDGVREPVGQRQCHMQYVLNHVRNSRAGRHSLRAIVHIFRPANGRHIRPPGFEKRMTTIRGPCRSLASVTCAYERICDGAALAQVGVVRTTWANVYLSWIQRCDRERWKRDKTLLVRLANARQTK